MADFAKLCVALARHMGWDEKAMVDAIWEKEANKARDALLGSPAGVALLRMLEQRQMECPWHGTAESLLGDLSHYKPEHVSRDHWPSTPQAVGRALTRLETSLGLCGWKVSRHRTGESRDISIEKIVSGKKTSCSSETSRDAVANDICDSNDVFSGETFSSPRGDAHPGSRKSVETDPAERMADEIMGKHRESF